MFLVAADSWSAAQADSRERGSRLFDAVVAPTNADRAAWSRLSGFAIAPDGRVVAEPAQTAASERAEFAHAIYTVPAGAAGFYAIEDSFLRRDTQHPGRVALRVAVRRAGASDEQQPAPAVVANLREGEGFDFDSFLGYLNEGDAVQVSLGADGDARGDRTEIDFRVGRTPLIPVSVFPDDFPSRDRLEAPGGWSLASDIIANAPAARRLAWGREETHRFETAADRARVSFPSQPSSGGGERANLAAFRVPHSGYYAVHNAWLSAAGSEIEARWYVGHESAPRRSVVARPASRVNLSTDLGYVRKGDVIYLALRADASAANATAEFAGSIVEWAPRRAPLRVRRGSDGLLDVFEPEAPLRAIDLSPSQWITVAASEGDATESIRRAFATAKTSARNGSYVGIRLEAGKTYVLGSAQVGGTLFPINDAQRIVFDGNGATLQVSSPELLRTEVELFTVTNSRNVVFADFTVTATSVPFTIGEILAVTPKDATTQTLTFRVEPGAADPLADIRRNGEADGFAYDPKIPGRFAEGTWTHYPGEGSPSLAATDRAGVFTHRVRRTGKSILPGQKWLIKNKRGGVVYLITQGGTENVTLSGVIGRASGGTHLRFWQTSGVNLLGCRFEPEGDHWIGASADSIHGRGREGVWLENTVIRGICEDIINTYGENMVVAADDDPADAVMSIRMFQRSNDAIAVEALRQPTRENIQVGDRLMFFNPQSGRVLGYANVEAIAAGRYTLSNRIHDVDTWEEGDDKGATMVYNTRAAGRFFVRDSRLTDSMRYGIYIKARGGAVFHTQFEGLSSAAIGAVNEPEWPEGPPATHLWVQDCFFSQNNFGYQSRHRAFMTVDPAEISVYTRRLRTSRPKRGDASAPDDFRAHLTPGEYANSHVKLLGNTFHDWRGMGIAVRNAHNVRIEDNLFLAPVEDAVMRGTLAADPALVQQGRGVYAAIYLDSVDGGRVAGNRFRGLPTDDRTIVRDRDVEGLSVEHNNLVAAVIADAAVAFSFPEWFGATSVEAEGRGTVVDRVELRGAVHRLGRLGAGLAFAGGAPAVVKRSNDHGGRALARFSVALWARPAAVSDATAKIVYAQGDERRGVVVGIDRGRWTAGVWQADRRAWLDLGPAVSGIWQHLALVFDGPAGEWRGYVEGEAVALAERDVPGRLEATATDAFFGGTTAGIRFGVDRTLAAGEALYSGEIDEFRLFHRVLSPEDVAALAFKR